MRVIKHLLIAAILLWAGLAFGAADTSYVGGTGAADDGTCVDEPQTHPCATIQYLITNKAQEDDDIIEIRAGTYREIVTFDESGTGDTDRITMRPASGATVIITGATVLSTGGGGFWTQSDTANEWYYHAEGDPDGDPALSETHICFVGTTARDRGTLTSLASEEWVWDEPTSTGECGGACGFDTVVVYSTSDPDTLGTVYEIGGQLGEETLDLAGNDYITLGSTDGTLIIQGGNTMGVDGATEGTDYIDMTNVTVRLCGRYGIQIQAADYWDIDGCTIDQIKEDNSAAFGDGITVRPGAANDESTNITIQNTTVQNVERQGIAFIGVNTGAITDCTIGSGVENTDIDFEPNEDGEIVTGVTISGCTLSGNAGISLNSNTGVTADQVLNITITQNTFSLDSATGVGIRADDCQTGILISDNLFSGNIYRGIYALGTAVVSVGNNWFVPASNGYPVNTANTATVNFWGNVVNGGQRGFSCASGTTCNVYNNSFYGFTEYGILGLGTTTAKNNIVQTTGTAPILVYGVAGGTYTNNLYYTNDTDNMWRWAAVTDIDNCDVWDDNSGETDWVWGDPYFISAATGDFRLYGYSPAVGTGADLGGDVYDDILDPDVTSSDFGTAGTVTTWDMDLYLCDTWMIGAYGIPSVDVCANDETILSSVIDPNAALWIGSGLTGIVIDNVTVAGLMYQASEDVTGRKGKLELASGIDLGNGVTCENWALAETEAVIEAKSNGTRSDGTGTINATEADADNFFFSARFAFVDESAEDYRIKCNASDLFQSGSTNTTATVDFLGRSLDSLLPDIGAYQSRSRNIFVYIDPEDQQVKGARPGGGSPESIYLNLDHCSP